MNNNIIAYEISTQHGGTINENLKNGLYNEWDTERIKKAFNFGNGNISDFITYKNNNKNYCKILFVNELTDHQKRLIEL